MFIGLHNHKNISFQGLRQNLLLGEQVYRDFNRKFPFYLHSNSYIKVKMMQKEGQTKYSQILQKVDAVAQNYAKDIQKARSKFAGDYVCYDDFIRSLTKVIRKKKCANCMEQADIVQSELLYRGKKPHVIGMIIKDKNTGEPSAWRQHAFTVFGLKKGAKPEDPGTWGNSAVVVDTWGHIVMQAKNALEYLKQFFGYLPSDQTIEYKLLDKIKIG